MKIETSENGHIVLKEVYAGLSLVTRDQEVLDICMRDQGFELTYSTPDILLAAELRLNNGKVERSTADAEWDAVAQKKGITYQDCYTVNTDGSYYIPSIDQTIKLKAGDTVQQKREYRVVGIAINSGQMVYKPKEPPKPTSELWVEALDNPFFRTLAIIVFLLVILTAILC